MIAAIQVEDLRYSYGDAEAVKGISFEVAPGEIRGFLGPNGAGKSTTIRTSLGRSPSSSSPRTVRSPAGGAVRPGQRPARRRQRRLAHLGAGSACLHPAERSGTRRGLPGPTVREFAHLHPEYDGSLHLALPAEQAADLVAKGWGCRTCGPEPASPPASSSAQAEAARGVAYCAKRSATHAQSIRSCSSRTRSPRASVTKSAYRSCSAAVSRVRDEVRA